MTFPLPFLRAVIIGWVEGAALCKRQWLQCGEAIGRLQSFLANAGGVAPVVQASAVLAARRAVHLADVATPLATARYSSRFERTGQIERAAVDQDDLDAADKVVAVHLGWPFLDALDRGHSALVHWLAVGDWFGGGDGDDGCLRAAIHETRSALVNSHRHKVRPPRSPCRRTCRRLRFAVFADVEVKVDIAADNRVAHAPVQPFVHTRHLGVDPFVQVAGHHRTDEGPSPRVFRDVERIARLEAEKGVVCEGWKSLLVSATSAVLQSGIIT